MFGELRITGMEPLVEISVIRMISSCPTFSLTEIPFVPPDVDLEGSLADEPSSY